MAVGLATLFAGYTLAYFGYCSIKGPGVGFLDLLVPGRTVMIPTSGGSGSSGSGESNPLGLAEKTRTPGTIGPTLGNGAPPAILGVNADNGQPVPYA